MPSNPDQPITTFVCGPDPRCDHDGKGEPIMLYGSNGKPNGESTTCSKCGASAFEVSMWRDE